ncbi:MAG: glycosyltransferase [Bdellovibrionales bacterium]|nr:glycosyltransferase [Bdellovibrionales bacterium]
MSSLEIAFFGSSLLSSYWNGAATYYRGILKYLHRLGHSITFYEPDAFNRQSYKDFGGVEFAASEVYAAETEADVLAVTKRAQGADVVIKASGVGVWDELLEAVVLENKIRGAMVIFWDVDAPATLARVDQDPTDSFRQCVPEYDLILTYGGGPEVIRRYGLLGARRCVPIYNALDPETHYPVRKDVAFEATLGLLANRLPDREARIEKFFFDVASVCEWGRFVLGGNGWEDKQLKPNVRLTGHVPTEQHNSFNSSPLAVLNVNRESMAEIGYSPATRVFEALGSEACLITDSWPGLDKFLNPGSECLVANDTADVVDYLRELTPSMAAQIGKAGRERVLQEHTYEQRAELVEKVLLDTYGKELTCSAFDYSTQAFTSVYK